MDSGRLAAQRHSLPFFDWYSNSPHQLGRLRRWSDRPAVRQPAGHADPGVCRRSPASPRARGSRLVRVHDERAEVPRPSSPRVSAPHRSPVGATGRRHHQRWLGSHRRWPSGCSPSPATRSSTSIRRGSSIEVTIRAADAVPVAMTLESPRFSPDPHRLAAAISPRTRAVLINSPHNPTGRVLLAAELERSRRSSATHPHGTVARSTC